MQNLGYLLNGEPEVTQWECDGGVLKKGVFDTRESLTELGDGVCGWSYAIQRIGDFYFKIERDPLPNPVCEKEVGAFESWKGSVETDDRPVLWELFEVLSQFQEDIRLWRPFSLGGIAQFSVNPIEDRNQG